MLSEIIARCPEIQTAFREKLANDRIIVKDIENLVDEYINQDIEDSRRANLNRQLNEIQSDLEDLANEEVFWRSPRRGEMNELDKILAGLVRRTVAGEQQWKRSVSDHEFVNLWC